MLAQWVSYKRLFNDKSKMELFMAIALQITKTKQT